MCTVGTDAEDYVKRFDSLGIDTRLIQRLPGTLTAQCFITTDQDNNQITSFHPGAMSRSAENDLTGYEAPWAIVAPDSKEGMISHAKRLHAQGTPFIFDLGQAMPLFDGEEISAMLELASAMTVNDYEASGQQEHNAPVTPTAVVDPTGCGDAHRAGLLYGLTAGWSWSDACKLGSLMGSIKIASSGPQNHAPTRAQVNDQLQGQYGLSLN